MAAIEYVQKCSLGKNGHYAFLIAVILTFTVIGAALASGLAALLEYQWGDMGFQDWYLNEADFEGYENSDHYEKIQDLFQADPGADLETIMNDYNANNRLELVHEIDYEYEKEVYQDSLTMKEKFKAMMTGNWIRPAIGMGALGGFITGVVTLWGNKFRHVQWFEPEADQHTAAGVPTLNSKPGYTNPRGESHSTSKENESAPLKKTTHFKYKFPADKSAKRWGEKLKLNKSFMHIMLWTCVILAILAGLTYSGTIEGQTAIIGLTATGATFLVASAIYVTIQALRKPETWEIIGAVCEGLAAAGRRRLGNETDHTLIAMGGISYVAVALTIVSMVMLWLNAFLKRERGSPEISPLDEVCIL